ncbi:MAG: SpaH/EbpB family LPXTG-anchored major pilin [Eubacteriales bacterium]|nr:SpaH/EbpB family LPXTG-anchored major pilin [Eubacteriales bacterium]
MTKIFKKMVSAVITVIMVMSLGISVFAEDFTFTISKPADDTATHTYTAYQIFSGTRTESVPATNPETYYLTNVAWGSGVDGDALLIKLKADSSSFKDDFKDCTDATSVATVLGGFDETKAMNFAKFLKSSGCLKSAAAIESTDGSFTGVAVGYYLITDSVPADSNGAASAPMLKAVGIHTLNGVEAKEDLPTLDKKIVEGENTTDANTAAVGDTIKYRITSKVPDVRGQGYNDYWFSVSDTFCKGLMYNGDVTVKIDNNKYTDVSVTSTGAVDGSDKSTIYITLNHFLDVATDAGKVGKSIVIEYTATLTKDCDMTPAGNENTARLIFSNDPNEDYSGTFNPDNPGKPVGKTPEKKTKTYTTGIAVIKVDDSTPAKRLTGADFEIVLSGTSTSQVVVETEKYTVDASANPAYYKLADGSYSLTAPAGVTNPVKYAKTIERSVQKAGSTTTNVTATVDDQGYLVFEGLGVGEYTISEAKAPTGYIRDTNSHTITITANPDFDNPNWSYKVDNNAAQSGAVTLTFTNVKSSNLPETGGIGRTVFYVAGSVLLLAGVSLFAVKKKTGREETK